MDVSVAGDLDFNAWQDLARRDPAAFEARRREAVQALIERSPSERRERLRCLQWRIDRVRERSHTPMAGCLSLYGMMWDSLLGSGGLAETLREFSGTRCPVPEARSARILHFPAPRRDHR